MFLAIARAMAAGSAAPVPAEAPKAPISTNLVSSGKVTKVDKTGGKLTIKYGPYATSTCRAVNGALTVVPLQPVI